MSDEKKTTVEDVGGEWGFRLVWSVQPYWADVTAYKVSGIDTTGPMPLFDRKGATSWPDGVSDHNDAEPYLTGYIKWDGCIELDQGRPHWCSPIDIKKHCSLLRYIYERSFELMGREPEEPWGL